MIERYKALIFWLAATALVAAILLSDVDKRGISESVAIGGEFSLINQDGVKTSNTDFAGRPILLYFGFTYCPDVCPNDLMKMTKIMKALGSDADKIAPVFITLDPERDTPQHLKEFSANFDSRITYLTGNLDEIEAVTARYKVFHERTENASEPEKYLINHSSFMYFVTPEGKYITHFADNNDVPFIAAAISKHLNK